MQNEPGMSGARPFFAFLTLPRAGFELGTFLLFSAENQARYQLSYRLTLPAHAEI